ncbi:hydrogenase maturation nickel metallochaperone HypA [Desulfobaculum senezii]|jgi:hydrogenase nickel incorporation protein HypA/HybF|uniref:hydrogenase maturation nickel metallochaperone HypA n=1 Tax=Desulfobaculum sp. SPO524 TaxID=3378071 RepID=UPI003851C067
MHELAIVTSILEIAKQEASKYDAKRITRVRLKVGEMSCLEARTLTSCFEICAEGTPAQGAELIVNTVPVTWKCKNCQNEFEEPVDYACPSCGSKTLDMMTGRELLVESLDVET